MGEVTVYKCVVCGRAFGRKAGLRGHLRVHRDIVWVNFTVRLPKARVEEFKALARKHNTTTCHLVLSLMEAAVQGDKLGYVTVSQPNPLVVNLHQYFMARPRGRGKYDFYRLAGFEPASTEPCCLFCGQPALIECYSPGLNPVKLCGRHLHYKSGFMQYRVVK